MHVMWLALPDGSATVRLPDGCRRIRLPRCGHTLRNARTLLSEPRTMIIGSAATGQGAEIQWLGQLRFMHGSKPDFLPDLLELFLEDVPIAVDSAVDIGDGFTDV